MIGLPAGWVSTTLGDLSAYVTSGSRDWSRYYADEGSLFVRTQDINQNKLADPVDIARVSLPEHVEGKRTLIQRDDILITITGANVGKCAHVIESPPEAYVSQSVALVRPVFGALSPFVQRQLIASPEAGGKTLLELSAYGLGRPVLSLDGVRDVPVRLAPLAEQRRIVAKLDALTAGTARARADLDRIPALAARYRSAVLNQYYDADRVSSNQRLEDVTPPDAKIIYGILQPGPDMPGGVPYVRPTEIVDGRLELDAMRRTSPEIAHRYRRSTLAEGDVLLSIVGTIGKVAVVPANLSGANITQSSCRIRPRTDQLTPAYLRYFLLSPLARKQYGEARLGTAVPRLNLEDVRDIRIPLRPLSEQAEVVRHIDSAFAEIDRLTAEAAAARRLLDRLDQAVLTKAFRGELVPQDPADEPATVLLDRIRAERAAAPPAGRRRKAKA